MLSIFQILIYNSGSLLGVVVVIVMLHIDDFSPVTELKLALTVLLSVTTLLACLMISNLLEEFKWGKRFFLCVPIKSPQ